MTYSALILGTAKIIGIPGYLLLAICHGESNLKNTIVPHDGGSPSYGVCQMKYSTAKFLGYKGTSQGLMNPKTNVTLAAKYLKYQLDRYDNNFCKATSAYNAGSYIESQRFPGKPKNLKYITRIKQYMDPELHYKLSCEDDLIEEANNE